MCGEARHEHHLLERFAVFVEDLGTHVHLLEPLKLSDRGVFGEVFFVPASPAGHGWPSVCFRVRYAC